MENHFEDNRIVMMQMAGISSWLYDIESGKRVFDAGSHLFPEFEKMDDFLSHVHKSDVGPLKSLLRVLIAGGKKHGTVTIRVKENKSAAGDIYLETFCSPRKESGKTTGIFFLTKDITLRKKSEREALKKDSLLSVEKKKLESAYTLLGAISDRMPCLFYAKDIEHDFKYYLANPKFCDCIGKKLSEVIRHTDTELFPKKIAESFRESDLLAIEKGAVTIKEETCFRGITRMDQTYKFYVETPDNMKLVVCMSTDVTDIYKAYDDVKRAKIEAERSDKMKSMFMQNVCHELVTPLNSVLGFSQLLVDIEDKKEQKEMCDEIVDNGRILKEIIEELVDLTKVGFGMDVIKKETFDLTEYINEMKDVFSSKVKEGVEFRVETPGKPCIVTLDKEHLSKIISRGVMTSVGGTYSGYICLGYECVPDGVRIFVEDTGIGLSEEEAMAVTECYENINGFTESMAFSLSLCKILAKIMGGTIDFSSTKGAKSRIWMFLPTPRSGDRSR